MSLVAERPPKVAVGFNPSAAQGIESLAEETMVLETVSSHGNRMTWDRVQQVPNRPWKLTKPQPQQGIDCHA